MTGKPEHWERAQVNERKFWEGLIAACMEGPPLYGGEKFWLDLWAKQGKFLRSFLGHYMYEDSRTLEIGGGIMGGIRWLKGVKVSVDPLGDLFCEAYPKLSFKRYGLDPEDAVIYAVGAAEDIEWASMGLFDFVLLFNTLDHCRDPEKVLQAIYDVLDPDGWLLEATTAFHVKMETSEAYQKHHPWAWTKDELMKMISDAGFDLMGASNGWPTHPGFKEEGANSDQALHIWKKK